MTPHRHALSALALLLGSGCDPTTPTPADAAAADAPVARDAATDAPPAVRRPLDGRVFLQQNAEGWRLRVAFRETNPDSALRCAVERVGGCWFQDCERHTAIFSADSTAPVSAGVFRVLGGNAPARATPEDSGYYPPAFAEGALWSPGQTMLTLRAEGAAGGALAFDARMTAPRPLPAGATVRATRGRDFVFAWDGADARDGEEVGVRGEVTVSTGSETSRNVEFVCFAPRSAATLVVPRSVVDRVPPDAQGALYAVAHEDRVVGEHPTLIEVVDTTSGMPFTF